MAIGAIAAIVGGLASAYGASRKTNQLQPDTYNAYGEKNTPNSGAIAARDSLFETLNGGNFTQQTGDATTSLVQALQNASKDPRLGAISGYGSDVLKGKYLNSPVINQFANQAADRITSAGADSESRLRSNFASNGMGFSTGLAQALQGARTATAAKAATAKSGILAQNYATERGFQQQAPSILSNAVQQPLGYLSQVNNALYQPLQLKAGLTQSLMGGNQVIQPTLMQDPSTADKLSSGLQSALSLYSLYNGMKTPKKADGTV